MTMQNVYANKEKALQDFGEEELRVKFKENFNKLPIPLQIMYQYHLKTFFAPVLRKERDELNCEQLEDFPDKDYKIK